ncbi:tetratricopeptide repeat protein [Actinokineospora auranticolor]|uniref:Tetratricopeptide repeat protein n=2 Tax=Actinokineospora auranticolor TaxID=155976 RepID=A0A2S6GX84_9PSEU|nr:tetratricopeptide repeat protein [Actinokineospora auranticolor]
MGSVGKAVQAGTIHGGVHLNGASRDLTLPCWFGPIPPPAKGFQRRGQAPGPGECVVLCGMGGLGKTQLAAEYARAGAEVVAWITAASRDDVVSGLVGLAAQLSGVTEDPDRAVAWVLSWLATTDTPWLLVFDDVWDTLDGLWPTLSPAGRMVVTTRRQDAAAHVDGRRLVAMGLFTPAQSQACLAGYHADRPHLVDGAEELAVELGHLPLAIGQAGAYMADRRLSCAQYLARWRTRELETLSGTETDRTVAVTWSLSVERAVELEPAAGPLLRLAALLDPNGIPLSVLTSPPVLNHLTAGTTEEDAWDALACLDRLSLITLDERSDTATVRVHALVQRATRERLSDTELAATAQVAADALLAAWPRIELDARLGAALRANTAALATTARAHLQQPDIHVVLIRAGNNLGEIGQVARAFTYFTHLHAAMTQLSPDSHGVLVIRHNLAYWRAQTGDAAGAFADLETLLPEQIRLLGRDHPDALTTRHNLAQWRGRTGDAAGALADYEALLPDRTRVLGPDHRDTLLTRYGIAYWRGKTGDPTGALADHEVLLADRIRVLGPDHPDTLATRHSIAYWLGESGDAAGALAEYETLLPDKIRVMGPEHPDTLLTRHNLAQRRGIAGDRAGTRAELEAVLDARSRVLGPDHPDTLLTRQELAHWQRETK